MKKRMVQLLSLVLVLAFAAVPVNLAASAATFETEPMVVAGGGHSVALKSDGTVWAWGYDGITQLGDGKKRDGFIPVQVKNLSNVKAIASRNDHTVALKSDGTVWTWGNNYFGQLGDGTKTNRPTPVQVKNLSNVKAISAGRNRTVALKDDGTVWAWGENGDGGLGNGTTTNRSTPVQVKNLSNVKAVDAGIQHTVALKNDGTVWAWGYNLHSQLGDGTTINRSTPVQVKNLCNVKSVSAGYSFTVVLKNDETVWTWGFNLQSQLGDGTTTNRSTPVQVKNLSNVKAISSYSTAVALKNDKTVWAWGYNGAGQLGNGTTTNSSIPVQVEDLNNVQAIDTSAGHMLALKNDGTVWGWGANSCGQLGQPVEGIFDDPDEFDMRTTPVQVRGIGGKGYLNLYEKTPDPTSIKLNPTAKTLAVGESAIVYSIVSPVTANNNATWASSNKKVATVDRYGKVTAKGIGTATITAKTLNGLTATCEITAHAYVSLRIGNTKAIQNSVKTTIDSAGTKPFIISGRTVLPIRFVSEKMGAKVKYIDDKTPITIVLGKITVKVTLGSKKMEVNNNGKKSTVTLDVPAQKKNGKTYIPLRAIGQALGFDIYYDSKTEIIIVSGIKMSVSTKTTLLNEAKAYIK